MPGTTPDSPIERTGPVQLTDANLHESANPRNIFPLRARGRLKKARLVRNQSDRCERPSWSFLQWVADHACLAYPANPEGAVRRCCHQFDPEITEDELDELVAHTEFSNKDWTDDHSAMVVGISFNDNLEIGFRFIACNDDPNYDRRRDREDAMSAVYSRRYRAKMGATTKRGRPALVLTEADELARRAKDAERKRAKRAERSSGRPRGRPKKCVRENSSDLNITDLKNIKLKPDELIRADFSSPSDQPFVSRAPQAPERLAPIIEEIVVDRGAVRGTAGHGPASRQDSAGQAYRPYLSVTAAATNFLRPALPGLVPWAAHQSGNVAGSM
jgi:hypothetical protein